MSGRGVLRVAKRLDEVGFSDIVQIRNKVMALKAEGKQVYPLHGGEPYFETPDNIKDAMTAALKANQTHYAPSSGIAPLREALAAKVTAKNGIPTTVDQVIATVGGSQSRPTALSPATSRSRRFRYSSRRMASSLSGVFSASTMAYCTGVVTPLVE